MFNTEPMTFDGYDDTGLAIFREAEPVKTQHNGREVIVYTDDGEDLATILKFQIDQ